MNRVLTIGIVLLVVAGCNRTQPQQTSSTAAPARAAAPAAPPAVGIYVTNETGGDLSVIDAATNSVVATVPLGKRPRGIVVMLSNNWPSLSPA